MTGSGNDEPLSSGGGPALEPSDFAPEGRIVGQETAVVRSCSINIPTREALSPTAETRRAGPQLRWQQTRPQLPVTLMNQPHTDAINQGSRQNFRVLPYYVSSNIFNMRIAMFGATIEGSYKVQLWDAKALTTVWERQVVREELTWLEQYPSFSLDGCYVGFYIA
jgi:hypothetical protein